MKVLHTESPRLERRGEGKGEENGGGGGGGWRRAVGIEEAEFPFCCKHMKLKWEGMEENKINKLEENYTASMQFLDNF